MDTGAGPGSQTAPANTV